MLKFYTVYHSCYHNGTEVGTHVSTALMDESEAKNQTFFLNWDNLNEWYHDYGLYAYFNVWNLKKGRLVSFFNTRMFGNKADVKEWKHKDLNITIECKMYECNKSISEILQWHDSEKVLQYFKERNVLLALDK